MELYHAIWVQLEKRGKQAGLHLDFKGALDHLDPQIHAYQVRTG